MNKKKGKRKKDHYDDDSEDYGDSYDPDDNDNYQDYDY